VVGRLNDGNKNVIKGIKKKKPRPNKTVFPNFLHLFEMVVKIFFLKLKIIKPIRSKEKAR
jgi:hypothetical protein